jgi:hypothetical protein
MFKAAFKAAAFFFGTFASDELSELATQGKKKAPELIQAIQLRADCLAEM